MRKDEFSPWPWIRWVLVAVFYVLTVAIARDMIKRADQRVWQAEVKKEVAKIERTDALKDRDAANNKMEEMESELNEIRATVDRLLADNEKRIKEANALISHYQLKAATEQRDTIATLRKAAEASLPTKLVIPRWIPEPPVVVARKIKARAMTKHGNDFSGAKYEIERQTEAHEKLLKFQRMNNPTVTDVLAKAWFEKGEDYQAMLWETERQMDAASVIGK